MAISNFFDRLFPIRVCRRNGHDWHGGQFMGPHRGEGGSEFFALRYRIFCARCRNTLDGVPQSQWPKDGEVK